MNVRMSSCQEEPWRRPDFSRLSQSEQNTQVYKVRTHVLVHTVIV